MHSTPFQQRNSDASNPHSDNHPADRFLAMVYALALIVVALDLLVFRPF